MVFAIYVVGPRSIQSTDKYFCKFSVPRGGVEKTANEKLKNRNAEKGAHGYSSLILIIVELQQFDTTEYKLILQVRRANDIPYFRVFR